MGRKSRCTFHPLSITDQVSFLILYLHFLGIRFPNYLKNQITMKTEKFSNKDMIIFLVL